MNILFLNYEYPPLGGGAGVCTKYESEGLAKAGYNVTILTTWFEGEDEITSDKNLKLIRLKSKRKYKFKSNPFEMISWVKFAKNYSDKSIITNEFDICFANFTIPGAIVAKHIKKTKKIPYIIISHGQDIPFFFPKQMLKYHLVTYFWIKNLVKNSEMLVLLSKEMKKNADKFVGKKNSSKNIIIPNGCNTDIFIPDFNKKSKRFKIIFVGRLVEQKSPFTFLNAIKILTTKKIDFIVNILGDGPLREKMEDFVLKNELSDYIVFKGWVTKNEMLGEYQSANLQIISSDDEAMSIAALESLACGLYVISTPVSGNTELIENNINGQFFNFKNYIELAEKIENYYTTKFLTDFQIDEGILLEFREKYAWTNIVYQYDTLIKAVTKLGK
jgi:glycosyltransferase involved in cell wall biosynthesis